MLFLILLHKMTAENREYAYKNFIESGQLELAKKMLIKNPELEVKEEPKKNSKGK